MHVSQNWIDIAYLIAACLFVVGIKGLTKPKTAVRGNLLAAAGMGVAAVVTLLNEHIVTYEIIIAGVVVGGLRMPILTAPSKGWSMPFSLTRARCAAQARALSCRKGSPRISTRV